MRLIYITCLIFVLSGCTSIARENQGSYVEIYPISYSISFVLGEKQMKDIEVEWLAFKQQYGNKLLNNKVNIYYSTEGGKQKATLWGNELIENGLREKNVNIYYKLLPNNLDISVQLMHYKLITPICPPPLVGDYYGTLGCAVNSNRWQSITYPQNTISLYK